MPTKDWMTNYHTKNSLAVVWNIRPGVLHRKWGMLVLEVFKGHSTPEMKATITFMNTDLAVTLAGITSQLQVLTCCSEEVKDHLKQLYGKWLLGGNYALTPAGRIKKPGVTLLCQWTATAWQRTSLDVIVKGFRECCVSNRVDGSVDDMLWNDNRKVRNGSSKWEEYEGTDFEDLQTIKVVRVPLIGKGRWTLTRFIDTKLTEMFLL
jgi:hypothetical protein